MAGKLDKLTILVPESRELDLFAGMLEAQGAVTLRCPLVTVMDVEDMAGVDAWLARFLEEGFEDLILLTGEGLRRLAARSAQLGRQAEFLAAFGKTRTITRGPKPVRTLREMGLAAAVAAFAPTSQGVIDALAGDDLCDRRVGVQLYPGPGSRALLAALEKAGAVAYPVTPYRYASEAESGQVADVIRKLANGDVGMIAVTSSPQIARLREVARECGLEDELARGLSRTPVAAIGPVVEKALQAIGVTPAIRPQRVFHLKPFVSAIVDFWRTRDR